MQKTRLRIRFTKSGDLRWISHRDLARVWERLLRRANLELAFSQGFHPKPRISFPSALALGVEALDELVELEIIGTFSLADIERDIQQQLAPGMKLLSLEELPAGSGKARVAGFTFRLPLPSEVRASVVQRIDTISQQPTLEVRRENKTIVCDTDHPYFDMHLEGDYLVFTLPNVSQGSLKATDLLAELGIADLLDEGLVLQRTHVHLVGSQPAETAAISSQSITSQNQPVATTGTAATIAERRPGKER